MTLSVWMIVLLPLGTLLAVVYLGWRYARRGTTAVHRAAALGNASRLGELLSGSPALAHSEDLFGWRPLQYAAHWGQLESARVLLEHGAQVDHGSGRSPLQSAAAEGHRDMVEFLLAHGAGIDTPSPEDGATPLHSAIIGRHVEIVRLLLERGASVNARTKSNWTAAHLAAAEGDLEVVQALWEFGADWRAVNAAGHTPAETARHNGHPEVAEYVLRRLAEGTTSPGQPAQSG